MHCCSILYYKDCGKLSYKDRPCKCYLLGVFYTDKVYRSMILLWSICVRVCVSVYMLLRFTNSSQKSSCEKLAYLQLLNSLSSVVISKSIFSLQKMLICWVYIEFICSLRKEWYIHMLFRGWEVRIEKYSLDVSKRAWGRRLKDVWFFFLLRPQSYQIVQSDSTLAAK